MLPASFYLLTAAVAAGTILGLLHLRATATGRPPLVAGIAHGIVGAVGLALLLPAAFGPPRGAAAGAGAFGPLSACLLIAALAAGVAVLLRRRRRPAVLTAIHAGIAISGYVVLVAWYSVS